MTARSANTALENLTRGLNRTNLPPLPPAPGFDGEQDYIHQVELWKQWIRWEIEDPLVLKDEDAELYKKRILYAYKQAIMALRFWPEMWVEAGEWAFANAMEKEGNEFLTQGIAANPESCLLTFKQADRLETVLPVEEGEEGVVSRGAAIREPYNKLLDALYELLKKTKARETDEIAKIHNAPPTPEDKSPSGDYYDEEAEAAEKKKQSKRDKLIAALKQVHAVEQKLIMRTLSFAWIALMRAMRRVQGKGKVGAPIGGSRQILNDARLKGKITSDVYVASALIEHNVYKDPAGTKIFERGAKLFPEDEVFILEYLKHLLSIGDTTSKSPSFLPYLLQILTTFQTQEQSSRPPSTASPASQKLSQSPSLSTPSSTSTSPIMANFLKSLASSNAWRTFSQKTQGSSVSHPDTQWRASTQLSFALSFLRSPRCVQSHLGGEAKHREEA